MERPLPCESRQSVRRQHRRAVPRPDPKVPACLEDKDEAKAEQWATALASLLISEGGAGRDESGAAGASKMEIVNEIFEAVRFGMDYL